MRHIFDCIDGHTCGNPVRLITSGAPDLAGETMSEKRMDFIRHHDWIRTALMFEPRGHALMSGAFFYPPCTPDADASILYVETSGCLPMCGHGTIGAITLGLESGQLVPRDRNLVLLDAPAGRIRAEIEWDGEFVAGVRIFNIPSYLAASGIKIDCPGLGELVFDIAYGGNFYAIIEPQRNYPGLTAFSASDILRYSPVIRALANTAFEPVHPLDPSVRRVSHLLWTGEPTRPEAHARNAVFYGDSAIDRSPCGTGTSARMAQLAARGALQVGDDFVHESLIGSLFHGRVEEATTVGDIAAIRPSIRGWAVQTGVNRLIVDDRDPFRHGFQLV